MRFEPNVIGMYIIAFHKIGPGELGGRGTKVTKTVTFCAVNIYFFCVFLDQYNIIEYYLNVWSYLYDF